MLLGFHAAKELIDALPHIRVLHFRQELLCQFQVEEIFVPHRPELVRTGRFQMLLLGEQPWMTLGIYAKAEYTWGTTGRR